MLDAAAVSCDTCGNTREETGPEAEPEHCECCGDTLCEPCWFASHVRVFSD